MIAHIPIKVKKNFISILLVAIVVLNIVDGSFTNPSRLDILNFVLLAVCLILNLIVTKRKGD